MRSRDHERALGTCPGGCGCQGNYSPAMQDQPAFLIWECGTFRWEGDEAHEPPLTAFSGADDPCTIIKRLRDEEARAKRVAVHRDEQSEYRKQAADIGVGL